jgi:hypothetical protein
VCVTRCDVGKSSNEDIVVGKGTPERLGGNPRENAEDAYATFMDMPESEWLGLLGSMFRGGVLTIVEQRGFELALNDRKKGQERG